MIRFRRWREHNRRALKDVADKREKRGIPASAPLAMQKVIVATHLDAQFADFADRVGGAVAETYFLRAMQYAAEHDGHDGSIRVSRERFGPTVLGRPWQMVSKETGKKVYDALLRSTICVPIDGPPSADESADGSSDGPRTDGDSSADGRGPVRGPTGDRPPGRGGALPPPQPGEQGGDSRSRGYACDARAASEPGSGPRTGPQTGLAPPSPLPSLSFPDPSLEEGKVASPPPARATTRAEARTAARQRLREIVAALDQVARESHDATIDALESAMLAGGWQVQRRDSGEGFDLLAETLDGESVAVEVDRKSPRVTSLERLQEHDGLRVVVLRDEPDERVRVEGVDVLVAGHRTPKPVDLCPRHGRAQPCTVCVDEQRPQADPQRVKAEIADALKRLGKRAPSAAPQLSPETTAARAAMEADREQIRLGGQLAEIPEDDTRHAAAQALIAERPRGPEWAERAAALLDPLEAFGGSR